MQYSFSDVRYLDCQGILFGNVELRHVELRHFELRHVELRHGGSRRLAYLLLNERNYIYTILASEIVVLIWRTFKIQKKGLLSS